MGLLGVLGQSWNAWTRAPLSQRVAGNLLLLGLAVRACWVLFFNHPMDNLFSDPNRHWDNAHHFFDPGPMGSADPVLYQFVLHVLQQVTGENRALMGAAAALLSMAFPLSWYLFATAVLRGRTAPLAFAACVAWMPTMMMSYSFFMTETLLLPLLGLALWATVRAKRHGTAAALGLCALLWLLASLTRSVALPYALIGLGYAAWPHRRRAASLVLVASVWAAGLGLAARHSYPHWGTYSPFGNFNQVLPIYFLSGAKTYKIHIGNSYVYYFSSPSFYVSPFYPLPWETVRDGTYEFNMWPARGGEDLKEIRNSLLASNYAMLPRLIYENVIFLALGHSWPESNTNTTLGLLCVWERLIWFPCIAAAMLVAVWSIKRRGPAFLPVITVLFVGILFSAHLAPTEGRYRKPIEPLVMLTLAWGAQRQSAANRRRATRHRHLSS